MQTMTEAPKRRALGKGLESLLPRIHAVAEPAPLEADRRQAARNPRRRDRSQPLPDPQPLRRGPAGRVGRLHHRHRRRPADRRSAAAAGPLPADRRRAALARLAARRQGDHPGHHPPGFRRAGDGDDHRRESAAQRPESDGAGPRLRAPRTRVPAHPGADGPAHRQGSRFRRQFSPPAQAATGSPGSGRGRESSPSATPARCCRSKIPRQS